MKKYNLLFLIIFCFAFFDTDCSENEKNNLFKIFSAEIMEHILFFAFANADDPFPFIFTAQKVCWAWRNLVLKSKNIEHVITIYKEKKNKEFFDKHIAYISGDTDSDNPPDYAFFDSPVFDVITLPRFFLTAFDYNDFCVIEKLIKKDNKFLNDFLLGDTCVTKMIKWDCVCVCEYIYEKCCKKTFFEKTNQKIIIDYIVSNASSISNDARRNIFHTFILDCELKFCMLNRLLPVLKIEELENRDYYFRYIVYKIVEMGLSLRDRYDKLADQPLAREDYRLNYYLLILLNHRACFSLSDEQKVFYNQKIVHIKDDFPMTKKTLESILKK